MIHAPGFYQSAAQIVFHARFARKRSISFSAERRHFYGSIPCAHHGGARKLQGYAHCAVRRSRTQARTRLTGADKVPRPAVHDRGRQLDEAARQPVPPNERHPRGGGAGGRCVRRGARLPHGRRYDEQRAGDDTLGREARRRDHSAAQRAPQRHQRARAHRRDTGLCQSADERPPGHFARHVGRGRQGCHREAPVCEGGAGQQPDLLRHLLEHPRDCQTGARGRHEGARGRGARHAFLLRGEYAGLRHGGRRGFGIRFHAQVGRLAHAVELSAVRPVDERRTRSPNYKPDPDDLGFVSADGQPGYFAQKPCAARKRDFPKGR